MQGGGYTWPALASNESGGYLLKFKSKAEIINESSNSNLMGTIAMAKVSGQPNSATSEWFGNFSDNKSLDSQY
ncbi:peptidylprolyl isomerase [Prochlorococcus marinus]|uniref:peptidylprolyl isomerase n=1 Tax=Prochlorococcus marinus TaxID=1219 RepID=UPI001F4CCC58|nr:peptidylprolyl isomerase [Prochlorococcus marinus]